MVLPYYEWHEVGKQHNPSQVLQCKTGPQILKSSSTSLVHPTTCRLTFQVPTDPLQSIAQALPVVSLMHMPTCPIFQSMSP